MRRTLDGKICIEDSWVADERKVQKLKLASREWVSWDTPTNTVKMTANCLTEKKRLTNWLGLNFQQNEAISWLKEVAI